MDPIGATPARVRRINAKRGATWGWIIGFVLLGIQAILVQTDAPATADAGYGVRALASGFVTGGVAGWIAGAFWDWTDGMGGSAAIGAAVAPLFFLMIWITEASWRQPRPAMFGDLAFMIGAGVVTGAFMGALFWGMHEYGPWVGQNPMP